MVEMKSNKKSEKLVVGYLLPPKKVALMYDVLSSLEGEITFSNMDSMKAKEIQGYNLEDFQSIDILLHKLAHDMVYAQNGDKEAKKKLEEIKQYAQKHPHLLIIDPLDKVELLTNRASILQYLSKISKQSIHCDTDNKPLFRIPSFITIIPNQQKNCTTLLADADLSYPLIIKSTESCALERSHHMSIITSSNDLEKMTPPYLAQQYINHGKILYKAYVIGDNVYVARRKSLPDLYYIPENNIHPLSVSFNTQKSYPTEEQFYGPEMVKALRRKGLLRDNKLLSETHMLLSPEKCVSENERIICEKIKNIGKLVRQTTSLSLFGFDVITQNCLNGSGEDLYIVDVNYFPSYVEIEDFSTVLRDFLRDAFAAHTNSLNHELKN